MRPPIHNLVLDLYFNTLDEFQKGIDALEEHLDRLPNVIIGIDLKLHWQDKTLIPEVQKGVVARLQAIGVKYQSKIPDNKTGLNLICNLPLCFEDPHELTTFPNCDQCAYFEAQHCGWPRQMSTKYYSVAQKNFETKNFDKINLNDFTSNIPVTWFTPQRAMVLKINKYLENMDYALDFGCGNGFIDYLLLKEGFSKPIVGVDPYKTPILEHKNFKHFNKIPSNKNKNESFALISSLGDHNVPVHECFTDNKPDIAIFITFPKVFGRGGTSSQLIYENNQLILTDSHDIFSFKQMEKLGYIKVEHSPLRSFYFNDVDLRIYCKSDKLNLMPKKIDLNLSSCEPYPWEKQESSKNLGTSADVLS